MTLWRSTLQKISQLRKNGVQVTMKSYMQVPRSYIDPNFSKHKDTTPEKQELQKKLSTYKVQVTDKR